MGKNKKHPFWDFLASLFYGEDKKNAPAVAVLPPEVREYCEQDVKSTEAMLQRVIKVPESEEPSELDYWREKFAIDLEKQEQRKKRAAMREQRWLDWCQRRAERDEIRFRRSVLRDAQKQLRQTLKEERDIQREADQMIQWLSSHSRASVLAGGAVKMAGGVMTALRVRPDVVACIKDNLDLDIAESYFNIIDDLVSAADRLEQAEDAIMAAFDQLDREKETEISLESIIPQGLEK